MSRKRSGKSSDFDLDDVLGDLLGDDDDAPKKKTGPKAGRAARNAKGKGNSSVFDDDFYSQLAADAGSDSTVSEADPAELAKSLADLDDMDSALFGGKSPTPKTPPQGATGADSAKTKGSSSKPSAKSKRSSIDFDEDDPLAGLLSDEEDTKPKKPSLKKALGDFDDSPATPTSRPSTTHSRDEDNLSTSSRRLEIERPPTRSGKENETEKETAPKRPVASRRKADEITFDDDDVLGGMGFDDDLPKSAPAGSSRRVAEAEERPGRSIMDDLLGKDSVTKHLQKPGSADSKRETFLDKLTKTPPQRVEKETKEDDFQFGSYLPSSAGGSRPSSRRSVRFEDEDDLFGDRPSSRGNSAGRRRATSSFMEDMVDKDDRDWLDIASGSSGPTKKEEKKDRAQSTGSLKDKTDQKVPATANSAASEPADWLGLSRIGSPESRQTHKAKENGKSTADPSDFLGLKDEPSSQAGKPASDSDDWLGLGGTRKTNQSQRRNTPDRSDDWLGSSHSGSKETKNDDWLGLGETAEKKSDDWLGLKGSPGENQSPSTDYLGLGKDVDPDTLTSKPGPSRASNMADELFKTPEKDSSSALPWETPSSGRRGRRQQTPPSPRVRRGASTADSPRGLFNQLDAIQKADGDHPPQHSPQQPTRQQQDSRSQPHQQQVPQRLAGSPATQGVSPPVQAATPPVQTETPPVQITPVQNTPPVQNATPHVLTATPPVPVATPPVQIATPPVHIPSPHVHTSALPYAALTQPMATPTTTHLPVTVGTASSPFGGVSFPPVQTTATFSPGMSLSSSLVQQQQQLMDQQMAAARQQQLQLQEEAMKQQQQIILQQQQQEQMQMQQQMAAQQEQTRQQHQQQLTALQEAQQQLFRQQMTPQPLPQMTSLGLGSLGMSGSLGGFGFDGYDSQIKKLEMEKRHLEAMQEMTQKQHAEEIKLLEDSYKKRIQLLEETFEKREKRLIEEAEVQSARHKAHVEQMEAEKVALMNSQLNHQHEWTKQKQAEMEQVAEQHRVTLESLKQEHSEGLSRLRAAKNLEVEAVAGQHDHARSLQSVMQQVSDSTRDLGDLREKVQYEHSTTLGQRENAARAKDQELKSLQDRLERKHHETEVERARLTGLITKLELQLTEQARTTEEDKWRLKQEDTRMQTLQTSLEQERAHLLDQISREKLEVQKAKDRVVEEQKITMAQVYEERRALAEERAQFNLAQKLRLDQEQRDSFKNIKSEADLESSIRVLNDEKERLRQQATELQRDQDKLKTEMAVMEEQKRHLALEKEKLEHIALQVKQRSQDIEDMCTAAAKARDDGQAALVDARRIEADQNQRMTNIQAQLAALRAREKNIAQERLALAREKANMEKSRHSMLCVSCRTPIKDTNHHSESPTRPNMSPAALGLFKALNHSPQTNGDVNLDSVSSAIEMDRTVRMWRINASKDKDFLEEESMFLEAIKHTPYHSSTQSVD